MAGLVEPAGRIHGHGHVDVGNLRHYFHFHVREFVSHEARGRFSYRVRAILPGPSP